MRRLSNILRKSGPLVKCWIVVLATNEGKHSMYLVHALNEDIARDSCVRAHLQEHPSASFREIVAYETELYSPVKILED